MASGSEVDAEILFLILYIYVTNLSKLKCQAEFNKL